MDGKRPEGFGKHCRLLKKVEFSACYHRGKRHFTANFVFFVRPAATDAWRLGLSVSRKAGCAVQRNRVKRLLREFFRRNQTKLPPGLDVVAVAKKGLNPRLLDYTVVEQELFPLLAGLSKHYGKKPT